jgi:hypothetical protein
MGANLGIVKENVLENACELRDSKGNCSGEWVSIEG